MRKIQDADFISEKNYSEDMEKIAEPYLAAHGGGGFFNSADGKKLHYEKYLCENACGGVVIAHGFSESAAKFREMSYYFLKMGLNVFAIDHRGHSLSYRHTEEEQIVHIKSFSQYVSDLQAFVKQVAKPENAGFPLFLFSHSMGGAVSVQYLQTYKGDFSRAVLSAPMIAPKTAGVPAFLTQALSRSFILLGKEKKKVFVYKGFNPDRSYENSHDTSKARFDYYQKKRVSDHVLQTCAPSYRWVNEAVRVAKLNLDLRRCAKIKIPVLICQPEEDSAVVSAKEDEFVKLIPDGRLEKFTGCRHEIYMSSDETLRKYLDVIYEFLNA